MYLYLWIFLEYTLIYDYVFTFILPLSQLFVRFGGGERGGGSTMLNFLVPWAAVVIVNLGCFTNHFNNPRNTCWGWEGVGCGNNSPPYIVHPFCMSCPEKKNHYLTCMKNNSEAVWFSTAKQRVQAESKRQLRIRSGFFLRSSGSKFWELFYF